MSETDKHLADRVLQGLTLARYIHPAAAYEQVGALREDVGSGGNVERERAEAWLAISALYQVLSKTRADQGLDALWEKAIDKTSAWLAKLD